MSLFTLNERACALMFENQNFRQDASSVQTQAAIYVLKALFSALGPRFTTHRRSQLKACPAAPAMSANSLRHSPATRSPLASRIKTGGVRGAAGGGALGGAAATTSLAPQRNSNHADALDDAAPPYPPPPLPRAIEHALGRCVVILGV
jgi:hypothetical protein